MNQMICYIYEYKGTSKIQNSGFLKISSRGRTLLVQMHLKGLHLTNSESLSLSIFYKNEDIAITQKLLDLPVKNKSINMQFSIGDTFYPEQKHLPECDGFLFAGPYGEMYVASWKNVPFDTEKVRGYEAISTATDCSDPTQTDYIGEIAPQAPQEEVLEAQTSPACRKISRSEMTLLPRRSWNLANNSFLLHGFHNFHHLLLVELDDTFILGVPGLYDKKEARAADLFGFPLFSVDYVSEMELSEDESSDRENFGYWCRTIPKMKTEII